MTCQGHDTRASICQTRCAFALAADLALAMLGASQAHSQGAIIKPSTVEVTVNEGRLSARVDAAPLESVLQAIVAQTDLAIEVRGDLGAVRAQEFSDLPLATGLRRLIGDRGLVMIYDRSESEHRQRLSSVRVYGDLVPDPVARQPRRRPARSVASREASPLPAYDQLAAQSKEERLRTIRRLARRKEEAWVQVLSTVVAKDSEASIRRAAVTALGTVGGDKAAATLDGALADQSAEVRLAAVRGLRDVKGEEAAARLSEVASSDGNGAVRRQAILLLGTLRSNAAWSAIQAASTDPDQSVRKAADRVLSRRH